MNTQAKTKVIWNKLATWWDESYQEGDLYHRTFLFPTLTKWATAKPGLRILDIGCGNGALARVFAKAGADVVATDFSEVFIDKCQERSQGLSIDYRVIDATDPAQLESLIDLGPFDCVVSSMVLHDMPTITPLAQALPALLKNTGCFIFTVPNPCFNSGLTDIELLKKHMTEGHLIMPNRYIKPEQHAMRSKPGQPVDQLIFHRPLSALFDVFFDAGLVMNGFVEPIAAEGTLPPDMLWAQLSDIPPAVICRWVKPNPQP